MRQHTRREKSQGKEIRLGDEAFHGDGEVRSGRREGRVKTGITFNGKGVEAMFDTRT